MKATKKRKGETNKRKYMSDEAFAELKAAMEEAVALSVKGLALLITRSPRTSLSKDVSIEKRFPSIKRCS